MEWQSISRQCAEIGAGLGDQCRPAHRGTAASRSGSGAPRRRMTACRDRSPRRTRRRGRSCRGPAPTRALVVFTQAGSPSANIAGSSSHGSAVGVAEGAREGGGEQRQRHARGRRRTARRRSCPRCGAGSGSRAGPRRGIRPDSCARNAARRTTTGTVCRDGRSTTIGEGGASEAATGMSMALLKPARRALSRAKLADGRARRRNFSSRMGA